MNENHEGGHFKLFCKFDKNQTMITDKQRKNQILRKIQNLPPDKLKKLQEYLNKLDKETPNSMKVLSYAGAWKDMDESAFKELTDQIISRRQNNKRRFEE